MTRRNGEETARRPVYEVERTACKLKLFGGERMYSTRCPACADVALILSGSEMACCGTRVRVVDGAGKCERVSAGADTRRQPPEWAKREILEAQFGRCFWCDRFLGERYHVPSRSKIAFRRLRTEWDHLVPRAYTMSDQPHEFVAACDRCNAWKSDRIFDDIEAGRRWLVQRWQMELERHADGAEAAA